MQQFNEPMLPLLVVLQGLSLQEAILPARSAIQPNILGNASNVAGLVGELNGSTLGGSLTDTGSVTGLQGVAGIVGDSNGGTISGTVAVGTTTPIVFTNTAINSGDIGLSYIVGIEQNGDVAATNINVANNVSLSGSSHTTGVGGIAGEVTGTSDISGFNTANYLSSN